MTVNETTRVADWLYDTLHGDATLLAAATGDVWDTIAAQGTAVPYVVFQLQASTDVRGGVSDAQRIMTSDLWLVKAVVAGSTFQGAAKTIADRIDTLLQNSTGGVAGDGTVFGCVREETFRLVEVDDGVQYRHLGGLYRIWCQVP